MAAPPGLRRAARTLGAGAIASVLAVLATSLPAAAVDQPWIKPGTPFRYELADPTVAMLGPIMYSYATNHGGADMPLLWSGDAVTWTARTQYEGSAAYQDGDSGGYFNDAMPTVPWGIDNDGCDASTPSCDPKELWAPSLAFVGSHWVAFHAVKVAPNNSYTPYGRFAIYASQASSPIGPFTAISSQPIVNPSPSTDPGGALDPDVFIDEATGTPYLIWKTEGKTNSGTYPTFWVRQLNSQGTAFASGSTARKLLTVSQGWEGAVVENPSMTKVAGRWILLYSGNEYRSSNYATGAAICSGPTGPCTKQSANPILRSATGAYGPGGADGIVDGRGRFIATYAAWGGVSGTTGTDRRRPHTMELSTDATGPVRVIRRDIDPGAGSDFTWSFSPGGGYTSTPQSVAKAYQPAAGDFTGDGKADIAWYGAWDRPDTMSIGTATKGAFTSRSLDQRGTFVPLPGDYDGDGKTDIYWYQPGPDPLVADAAHSGTNYEPNARNDELWRSTGTGWTKTELSMPWAAVPIVGDFDGDGDDDIIWSQPGSAPDVMWRFSGGVPSATSLVINGNYRPVVGDFDDDGVSDILWYAPGTAPDYFWWFDHAGNHTSQATSATGEQYRPFAGNLDGVGGDDIFWYAPGPGNDYRWTGIARSGAHTGTATTVNGVYQPIVGDYDGNGVDDIFWYS